MSAKRRRDTLAIAEEAAEWLDVLQSGESHTNPAFVRWLCASPRHVEEFLLLTASEQASADVDLYPQTDVDALIAGMPGNVVSMSGDASADSASLLAAGRAATSWSWGTGIAAATAGLALLVAWSAGWLDGWKSYEAAVGEQRSIELEDGSVVHLNARSRVATRLSKDRRDVRLLEGEALFKVAPDAARPFRVEADDVVIRALGTQFNVDRHAAGTSISVIEGLVEVTTAQRTQAERPARAGLQVEEANKPTRLAAGEEARIASSGKVIRSTTDVAEAVAWRQRRLIFRDNTLQEIAAEFNRYNHSPQLIVEDAGLGVNRFGGTFDADEPDSLIAFLRGTPGLTVVKDGSRLVIRAQ